MNRVIAFFDCQNIYHSVKDIWPEYYWPNFDPVKLARLACDWERDRPATWRKITRTLYDSCIDHRDYRAPTGAR